MNATNSRIQEATAVAYDRELERMTPAPAGHHALPAATV